MILPNALDPSTYAPLISSISIKDGLREVLDFFAGAGGADNSPMVSTVNFVMEFKDTDGAFVSAIISNLTGPFGFMLMVIYFVVALLQDTSNGKELTAMDFARPAFWLIVADIILTNVGPIISSIMGLSNVAADVAINALSSNPAQDAMIDAAFNGQIDINDFNIIKLIWQFILGFIQWFIQIIASVILFIVLWSSKMELLVRLSFSPIGLATFADESQKNTAIHYFKKLVASAFYYAATVAAITFALENTITMASQSLGLTQPNFDPTNFMMTGLMKIEATLFVAIAPFAAIGLVSAAKSAVNEAFGV